MRRTQGDIVLTVTESESSVVSDTTPEPGMFVKMMGARAEAVRQAAEQRRRKEKKKKAKAKANRKKDRDGRREEHERKRALGQVTISESDSDTSSVLSSSTPPAGGLFGRGRRNDYEAKFKLRRRSGRR